MIYPRKLWVTYDAILEELNETFENNNFEELPEYVNARVTSERKLVPEVKGGFLVGFSSLDEITSEIVAYEAFHVAKETYDYIGEENINDQEPFAYLLEYIVKCIYSIK